MTGCNFVRTSSLDSLADFGFHDIVVAIGVFDGMHLGHQHLVETLCRMAEKLSATPVILTFYPHPREVLNSGSPVKLLATQHKKIELFQQFGVQGAVIFPFTESFASQPPDVFIHDCLLTTRVKLKGICVGRQWRFGYKGQGSVELLEQFAADGHFEFSAVDEVVLNNAVVSSTEIRRAITGGRLQEASAMLGRHFSISGNVVHGKKIASSKLKHPTANVEPHNGIIPPRGVYAGYTVIDNRKYPCAIAVGVAPTFHFGEASKQKLEVHVLGYDGNLYDRELEVEFVEYLREERCYSSPEQLKAQISDDIKKIKTILGVENERKE